MYAILNLIKKIPNQCDQNTITPIAVGLKHSILNGATHNEAVATK